MMVSNPSSKNSLLVVYNVNPGSTVTAYYYEEAPKSLPKGAPKDKIKSVKVKVGRTYALFDGIDFNDGNVWITVSHENKPPKTDTSTRRNFELIKRPITEEEPPEENSEPLQPSRGKTQLDNKPVTDDEPNGKDDDSNETESEILQTEPNEPEDDLSDGDNKPSINDDPSEANDDSSEPNGDPDNDTSGTDDPPELDGYNKPE